MLLRGKFTAHCLSLHPGVEMGMLRRQSARREGVVLRWTSGGGEQFPPATETTLNSRRVFQKWLVCDINSMFTKGRSSFLDAEVLLLLFGLNSNMMSAIH